MTGSNGPSAVLDNPTVPKAFTDYVGSLPLHYEGRLSHLHADGVLTSVPRVQGIANYFAYYGVFERLGKDGDLVDDIANAARSIIKYAPGGVDFAHDVDGGGYTDMLVEPTLFTEWVELVLETSSNVYARFSRARTAGHDSGMLRSPVMGGIALEVTRDAESLDPRTSFTVYIIGDAKKKHPHESWTRDEPAKIYDMSGGKFVAKPLSVGPLYNGHPNQMVDGLGYQLAIDTSTALIRALVAKG